MCRITIIIDLIKNKYSYLTHSCKITVYKLFDICLIVKPMFIFIFKFAIELMNVHVPYFDEYCLLQSL